jgi:hypothetical protein
MPTLAQNRVVDELFGEGLLGVKWGATLDEVKAVHPGGKTTIFDGVTYGYEVEDDRTILELERRPGDKVSFGFAGNSLANISVVFPDCVRLFIKLQEYVGAPTVAPKLDPQRTPLGIMEGGGEWRGSSVVVQAMMVALGLSFECTLVVSVPTGPVNDSRSDLLQPAALLTQAVGLGGRGEAVPTRPERIRVQ